MMEYDTAMDMGAAAGRSAAYGLEESLTRIAEALEALVDPAPRTYEYLAVPLDGQRWHRAGEHNAQGFIAYNHDLNELGALGWELKHLLSYIYDGEPYVTGYFQRQRGDFPPLLEKAVAHPEQEHS